MEVFVDLFLLFLLFYFILFYFCRATVRETIIPYAVSWYTGEAWRSRVEYIDIDDDDDQEEEEEEDSSDENDDDDDSDDDDDDDNE